ncbi:MAG: HAD-IIB family hydrolase, partial [Candidatus Omnitrophica bacterium]|nr:HAD-IIB family hydrolase [Candidatus Omnitrophota bacterium]
GLATAGASVSSAVRAAQTIEVTQTAAMFDSTLWLFVGAGMALAAVIVAVIKVVKARGAEVVDVIFEAQIEKSLRQAEDNQKGLSDMISALLKKRFKLIITDLDDTLVVADAATDEEAFENETVSLIEKLRQRGVQVAALTGKSIARATARYSDKLSVEARAGQYLYTANGGIGYVFDENGRIRFDTPIYLRNITNYAAELKEIRAIVAAEYDRMAAREKALPATMSIEEVEFEGQILDLKVLMPEISEQLRTQLAAAIRERLAQDDRFGALNVLSSTRDIHVSRSNKGKAVRDLVARLGIRQEDILILGDSELDEGMYEKLPGATRVYVGAQDTAPRTAGVIHLPVQGPAGTRLALQAVLKAYNGSNGRFAFISRYTNGRSLYKGTFGRTTASQQYHAYADNRIDKPYDIQIYQAAGDPIIFLHGIVDSLPFSMEELRRLYPDRTLVVIQHWRSERIIHGLLERGKLGDLELSIQDKVVLNNIQDIEHIVARSEKFLAWMVNFLAEDQYTVVEETDTLFSRIVRRLGLSSRLGILQSNPTQHKAKVDVVAHSFAVRVVLALLTGRYADQSLRLQNLTAEAQKNLGTVVLAALPYSEVNISLPIRVVVMILHSLPRTWLVRLQLFFRAIGFKKVVRWLRQDNYQYIKLLEHADDTEESFRQRFETLWLFRHLTLDEQEEQAIKTTVAENGIVVEVMTGAYDLVTPVATNLAFARKYGFEHTTIAGADHNVSLKTRFYAELERVLTGSKENADVAGMDARFAGIVNELTDTVKLVLRDGKYEFATPTQELDMAQAFLDKLNAILTQVSERGPPEVTLPETITFELTDSVLHSRGHLFRIEYADNTVVLNKNFF